MWASAATRAEAEGWLVVPASRGRGDVHGVHAGIHGREQRGQLAAGGVVGVQVDREVEPLPQRRDQLGRGRRTQQSGHVLDRQDVRPGVDDLLRQLQVVIQGVEVSSGIQHVPGVAEGNFGDGGSGLAHGADGRSHLVDVVEGIEDPENVDAGGGGLVDERHR